MPTDFRQHFTEADLVLLEGVLDRADLSRSMAPTDLDKRHEAARFLVGLFQQGVTDRTALAEALAGRAQPDIQAVADKSEQGSPSRSEGVPASLPTAGGYRYGRRVESNRTWTIYHVFTGVPAEFASWKMVGLNVRTAERALKILNAPVTKVTS